MNKRPLAVTIIACLFIIAGLVGFSYHVTKFDFTSPAQYELILVLLLRLLVIICGVFILRGSNWARWLLLVWIAYHVVLSAFHTLPELAIHSVLLVVVAYLLVRPSASAYFNSSTSPTANNIKS